MAVAFTDTWGRVWNLAISGGQEVFTSQDGSLTLSFPVSANATATAKNVANAMPPSSSVVVPTVTPSATRFQFYVAAQSTAGHTLSTMSADFNAAANTLGGTAQLYWQNSNIFQAGDSNLLALATQVGILQSDLNNLLTTASQVLP